MNQWLLVGQFFRFVCDDTVMNRLKFLISDAELKIIEIREEQA